MDMHFDGVIFQSHVAELARRLAHDHPPHLVVDVRDADEFADGHIAGALPVSRAGLDAGLPPSTTPLTEFFIIGVGPDDTRVRQTTESLRRHGALRCVEILGGIRDWRRHGYPLATGATDTRAA